MNYSLNLRSVSDTNIFFRMCLRGSEHCRKKKKQNWAPSISYIPESVSVSERKYTEECVFIDDAKVCAHPQLCV